MKIPQEPLQPAFSDWKFVDELTRPESRTVNWTRRTVGSKEADLSRGVTLSPRFPDLEGRLTTAYDDLKRFLTSCRLDCANGYPLITEVDKSENETEAFTFEVTPEECRLTAGDCEGIRRGLYYFENLLLGADGPFLPLGIARRNSWMKNRISRCFFGPIKRPPLNRDELLDDVDYYPDEYLNRLAREGVNGLWLTVAFRDLCKTSITPEFGADASRRLDKLSRTVKKCLRYGIKTYVFCIEPAAWKHDDPVLLQYPELAGAAYGEYRGFCPFSSTARQYLYEAVNGIFTAVPELGGMINISHGERITTCLSSVAATEDKSVDCPRCGNRRHGEILRAALTPMEKGMRDAAPNAQLISWLYMPQPSSRAEWVFTLPEYVPERVILQFNFESSGVREQLGKPRTGGDYWLSYPGPSEHFRQIAETANAHGVPLSAKIQVGCSHEVATVPFVPVPSLLYRKYQRMRELGVSTVMQCWYFGNYPGMMNRAAGMLAYEDFNDDETAFLHRLARPDWGAHSEAVVEAWQWFADGYSHYPLSNMFQYYGPMHDGIVWPLYLQPARLPLAPTWKLEFGTSGDHIGECLENHTIDEAIVLCREMAEKWHHGVERLKKIEHDFKDNPERLKDIGLAEALGIQFASGHAILRFYALREPLFAPDCSKRAAIIDDMGKIVKEEITRSQRLIELCKNDSRLGFHSEAEGYKYFPRKLAWRIQMLESLLAEDFVKTKQDIAANRFKLPPPESDQTYICGDDDIEHCDSFRWRAECGNQQLSFFIECLNQGEPDQLRLALSTANTRYPLFVTLDKSGKLCAANSIKADVSSNADGWRANINIPLDSISKEVINTAKLNITRTVNFYEKTETHGWPVSSDTPVYRLNLGLYNPRRNGVFILNQ